MERTELSKRLAQLEFEVWDVTEEVTRPRKAIAKLESVSMDTNDA